MRMTRIFKTALMLIILAGVSSSALAQQQAGPVIDDIHRRSNPSHPGYVGNNAVAPAQPREVWQNKYGAIAADFTGSGTGAGVAEDENSMRAAKRVAMQRCGTRGCKIIASTVNGCLAAVHGGGRSAVGGGNTREEAIDIAMNQCRPADGLRCELYYAYCNVPVRIR